MQNVEIVHAKNTYVTWACRYSERWSIERNLSDEEFIRTYAHLRQRFPDQGIMVVSDAVGCAHFAELARRHRLDCMFSKQYSQTFLGDGALILNSEFCLQVLGGGIAVIPIFSKIPYEITTGVGYEVRWSKRKAMSWQQPSQSYFIGGVYASVSLFQ